MVYKRQRCMLLHTLLEFLLLGKIRWNTLRFVGDLDTPFPRSATLALSMSQQKTQVTPSESFAKIRSRCHCGSIEVDVSFDQSDSTNKAINCHSEGSRRYHTGPFTSFLQTDLSRVSIRQGKEKIGKFLYKCEEFGLVESWFCEDCFSKVISVPQSLSPYSDENSDENEDASNRDSKENSIIHSPQKEESNTPGVKIKTGTTCLVNLGLIVEDEIPPTIINFWKEQLERDENNLHVDESPGVWVRAHPSCNSIYNDDLEVFNSSLKWSGGCSCGACRYEFTLNHPTEIQHCYCRLCRTLSGSPFMSWIPVEKMDFRWKKVGDGKNSPPSLQIIRTTPFGRRHICSKCKSVMTIVYDEQPEMIWPCAGSLDDSSLPKDTSEMGKCLNRACHICCRYRPGWLTIPDDGLERIEEAC